MRHSRGISFGYGIQLLMARAKRGHFTRCKVTGDLLPARAFLGIPTLRTMSQHLTERLWRHLAIANCGRQIDAQFWGDSPDRRGLDRKMNRQGVSFARHALTGVRELTGSKAISNLQIHVKVAAQFLHPARLLNLRNT